MVIVNLTGGLGNQMFQYAAGKALALRHGVELVLDLSWYDTQDLRFYELGCFALDVAFATPEDRRKIVSQKLKPFLSLAKTVGLHVDRVPLVIEPHYHYWLGWDTLKPPVYLTGVWQSERYFLEIANQIRADFSFTQEPTAGSRQALDAISACEAPVSIHIRRGDYVSSKTTNKTHGTCSPEYYAKAVELIAEKTASPHFFIFSDDTDWVRENFRPGSHPFTVVDVNDTSTGHMDMMLMAACSHHVIANSSFSWWGAWLGGGMDNIVCAPDVWFKDRTHRTEDIIPNNWFRL